jgi:glycosyltransferase involved in cell wall biosynthesis
MSRAVLVDWLGRGGIAQTSRAWIAALERRGHQVTVVTRGERELTGPDVLAPEEGPHALVTHRRLARLAAATVEDLRPDVVVVQNYVVPPLERPLDAALRRTGSETVVVVHDHRLHTRVAGTNAGLRGRVRAADRVVTHSRYVAEAVRRASGRTDVAVVPLPVTRLGTGGHSRLAAGADRIAINFGVMTRDYKGGDVVCALAEAGVPGWRFAVAGVGAPASPRVATVDGFVPGPDLAATLGTTAAAVLPYRTASQSAAVVLAQSLGVVPVATAVGGLPEQIEHGVDGLLLPPGATLTDWRDALTHLGEHHAVMADAARRRAERADARFRELAGALV